MLNAEGVEGDWQRNRKFHGGPDKAVLMISTEVIAALRDENFPVHYGSLGENLTVADLDPSDWRAGQRFQVGNATIELTTLRVPCRNLDIYGSAIKGQLFDARCKAGNPESPRWARGGFYGRVIRPGLIFPGARVILISEAA
jgi:MOSC domain-containing protein YiiM